MRLGRVVSRSLWVVLTAFMAHGPAIAAIDYSNPYGVVTNEDSVLTIGPGSYRYQVDAFERSGVRLLGGTLDNMYGHDASTFESTGGSMHVLDMSGTANGRLEGTGLSQLKLHDQAWIHATSVSTNVFNVTGNAALDFLGGDASSGGIAGSGHATIVDSIMPILVVGELADVHVVGGDIHYFFASGDASTDIHGGKFGFLYARDRSVTRLSGPTDVFAISIDSSEARVELAADNLAFSSTFLSGTWLSGGTFSIGVLFNGRFNIGGTTTVPSNFVVVAVPEVPPIAMLAIGMPILGWGMRRRSGRHGTFPRPTARLSQ